MLRLRAGTVTQGHRGVVGGGRFVAAQARLAVRTRSADRPLLPRPGRHPPQPLRPGRPPAARRVPRRHLRLPGPHFAWPPIGDADREAVARHPEKAVSIPDRSGVVADLEDTLAAYLGVRHVATPCTGTAALHSMYAAAGIGPGDKAIVPSLAFHATATPLEARGQPRHPDPEPLRTAHGRPSPPPRRVRPCAG
ncbi:DegT/DnrJ/EryC1/StrS family aminotransferase [Streptomyces sp. NPDC102437]|uniref:DegT/DnrJ/EryC1/StrS family aminotransferase n=1 Tax=Streptomyces sp. NPDC102437 TaxID=3366175 RepID=UPI0037FA4D66